MEEHFINYNRQRITPQGGFHEHDTLENAKEEAANIMQKTGNEIYIYKLVGIVKPKKNYVFEAASERLPF